MLNYRLYNIIHMALNKDVDFCEKISSEIKQTFLHIYNAVKLREIQLLRQIEALTQHYKLTDSYEKHSKQISVVFETENDILNLLSNYGRINLNGLSCESDIYKIEDYQKPENDHVSLHKSLETTPSLNILDVDQTEVVKEDLTKDPMIVETSILECIEKQDATLCQHVSKHEKLISDHLTNNLSSSASEPNLSCKCCAFNASCIEINPSDSGDISERLKHLSIEQPIQVQHWIKQIISEPETEPSTNNVMEHSHIKVVRKESV